jgi:hypothetical protein
MTSLSMDDCRFYDSKFHRCMALTEMICRRGACSFYKPREEEDREPKVDKSRGGFSIFNES